MARTMFSVICAALLLPSTVFATPYEVLNGTWSWMYCWNSTNVINGRAVFPGKPFQSANLTAENCAAHCEDPKYGGPYNFAGMMDGNKCYCANETYQDRPDWYYDNCGIPCSGAVTDDDTCGGTVTVEMYHRRAPRQRQIADLPYYDEGLHPAGCYNYSDLAPYLDQNLDLGFDSIQVCNAYCKYQPYTSGAPNPNYFAMAMGSNGAERQHFGYDGISCHCFNKFDFSKIKPGPLSYCNASCTHPAGSPDQPPTDGDPGQYCGGAAPWLLVYSNNSVQDFQRASLATSRTLWSSSVLAASTSRASARSSVSASKSRYLSSVSSARSRVSVSQLSASASRSTRQSSVNFSKTLASLSRSTARSVGATSKSSASSSRSSARSRVSASTSSAASAKSSRQQSLSASKSSYLSRYTSSSQSRQTALSDYTSRSRSSSISRSLARSSYTSRSQALATSKSVNSASLSSSRALASASRSSANAAAASSYTSNSLSLSRFYSSRSYSQYLASSSRSAASTTTGSRQARYGQIISVTTTVIVDTSSSDAPLTGSTGTTSIMTTSLTLISDGETTYAVSTTISSVTNSPSSQKASDDGNSDTSIVA